MRRCRSALAIATCLAAGLLASAAHAGDANDEAAAGALLYEIYCSNCHGDTGGGDGSMREVLRVPPPDLTRLAERHGGRFPAAEVRLAIDGRKDVRGHGRRDMPVWGLSLREPGSDVDQEKLVCDRLDRLVAFLRSIQVGEIDDDDPSDDGDDAREER